MTSTLTSPRPMRRRPAIRPVPGLLCSLVSALLLSACGGSAPEDPPATPTSDTLGDTVRHLVLLNEAAVAGSDRMRQARTLAVPTAEDTPTARTAATVRALGQRLIAGTAEARIDAVLTHVAQGLIVEVPAARSAALTQQLLADPAVLSVALDLPIQAEVEPLSVESAAATLDTTVNQSVADLWGLDSIDQRKLPLNSTLVRRPALDGTGVTAYVIDSGVSNHVELQGRLGAGQSFDGSKLSTDCDGHGTHVAGTIAGKTTGVAPGARIVSLRVLGCKGSGTSSSVLKALDWVLAKGVRPAVLNLSLGIDGSLISITDAVKRLTDAGFVVVVSAGNAQKPACQQSPASAPDALTVAASTYLDSRASYSNFGSCVDLFAPGSSIKGPAHPGSRNYIYKSGTSMASPHVAGAAALLLQRHPSMSARQVSAELIRQSTPDLITQAGTETPNRLLHISALHAVELPISTELRLLPPTGTVSAQRQRGQLVRWQARITLAVHTPQGQPVAGVRMEGRYSHLDKRITCTTSAQGLCLLDTGTLPRTLASTTFAVSSLSHATMSWRPADPLAASLTLARP